MIAAACAAIGLLDSCRQKKNIIPSAEFAPYISAFTGGSLSTGSTVVIELTDNHSGYEFNKVIDAKLFSFTPAVKGIARWEAANRIEFIPEAGELKPGSVYNATFALGKLIDVEKKFANFEFSFRIDDKSFTFQTKPVEIQINNTITVRGELSFNDFMPLSDVRKMLTADIGGSKQEVTVEGGESARIFQFVIQEIKRTSEAQVLLLTVDGHVAGINNKETRSVNIPAIDKFQLFEYAVVMQPEYGLSLTFSDLVSESQDVKSMIRLKDISDYTVQVQANRIMIYFTRRPNMTRIEATIDRGLKNAAGEAMDETREITLALESFKPEIELLNSGAIMPEADRILLPFRAVALRAVNVKIIRIFENNILTFLQINNLNKYAFYELRRAGRLVYNNTFRLDGDKTKDLSVWENYSLDLTTLIKRQPGAIYHIVLSFKREYSSYDCSDQEQSEAALAGAPYLADASTSGDNSLSDKDLSYWDKPNAYYYDGYDIERDWNNYEWSERDNPCHASFYMADRFASTNVYVSNLGLIAKCNANNTIWAAVSNLLDTKPVAGSKITVYNYQLQRIATATTDEQGFATITPEGKPFLLVAESGEQKAYLRLVDGEENMLSRFDVGGVELEKGLKGFIYGERGVWRPGDTMHLAFMLEDREGNIPASHPVALEIYNPKGQFYKKMISTSGVNGLYTFNLTTKADDPTGLWNAYIKVGGASFHKSLRIETVKPNRLKINIEAPELLDAVKKEESIGIHSQWLTGATAHDLNTKMELILSRLNTQFKGYEQYNFNNPGSKFTTDRKDVFDGKLDGKGDVRFDLAIPKAENAPGMLSASLVCRVFEPGGDASVFTRTVRFSPYSTYVGVNFNRKKDDKYLLTDEDHIFNIVTLDKEGKTVNVNGLEYSVYRIGWSWWWEVHDENFEAYINNTNLKPVYTGKINTVNGKGEIKFRVNYPDWGRFFIYVKDAKGGHATGGAVLVDWPSWRGRSGKEDPMGVKMLTFSLDKDRYEVDEDIVVSIPATAADGNALVAIENGTEVIQREWVSLKAGSDTRYTFKATSKMSPNVYVHISLLQPHASTKDLPIRMYGVMPVFVSNKSSVLTPIVTVAETLRPESEFTVRVKEQGGKAMTYTLAVVDEGLLDLTNFKTPDPWNVFYAREALGIRTWDLFDNVMGAFAGRFGTLFGVGGDEELNKSSTKANRFKPVVLYLGPLTLKAGEEQTHKLRLPAYIGSIRVMVVAGHEGAYGYAEKAVAVRSPLMLLSSLPRVLSTDETISLPVNIFAMENSVRDVTVKVETTGGKLKTVEAASQSVTFTTPGDTVIYFPMRTGGATGLEKVTITATGGGQTSKETIEIDVRNPNPPSLAFANKLIEKGQSAEFDYVLDADYEGNWVKTEVSRIPTVDISRRLDFLYSYDHFCSEQLTSRALPLLYMSEFKDLDPVEEQHVKTNITEAINSLYGRQLPNGGFAYWAGDGHVNDWISSYAGSFLVLAKERGYNVSSNVINKWIGYQRNVAQNWNYNAAMPYRYSYNQNDVLQAYRLYSLALAGAPDMGAMNRLKEIKDLSQQALWRLAAAYALSGKQDAANELVFNASTTVVPYSTNNSSYGSSYRDEAMILEVLVLLNKMEDAFKQAQKVSKNLSSEKYFTTQSTAYSMVAMGQLAAKMSGRLDFEWFINGQKQDKVDTRKAVFQKQLPTKPLSGKVKVENTGDGTIYYSLSTKTRPMVDTLPAVSENIRLEVRYTDMDGADIDETSLSQGADFYAVIQVSNISGTQYYSDVALTCIIPSGWEIFNERMVLASPDEDANKNISSNAVANQDIRDDRVLTYFDLSQGVTKEIKIRLQASYIGDFVLPAILCEAMYDASARARTKAKRVKVLL
jgi:uncharacterized protein YfaS (alpha-2-macroglobulin family)